MGITYDLAKINNYEEFKDLTDKEVVMLVGAQHYPIPVNWNDFEAVIYYIYQMENPGCLIHIINNISFSPKCV